MRVFTDIFVFFHLSLYCSFSLLLSLILCFFELSCLFLVHLLFFSFCFLTVFSTFASLFLPVLSLCLTYFLFLFYLASEVILLDCFFFFFLFPCYFLGFRLIKILTASSILFHTYFILVFFLPSLCILASWLSSFIFLYVS